jgi:hypothetical protein
MISGGSILGEDFSLFVSESVLERKNERRMLMAQETVQLI